MLKLNVLENCKEFYGEYVEQMQKIIAEGRVPISVAGLMQKRLNVKNINNSKGYYRDKYFDNYFDTGDAVVYHPDGRVKIVLDSQTLRNMMPSKKDNHALVLTEDVYKSLDGEELRDIKFDKIYCSLSKEDVKSHPVWKILARDQALLNDYADNIFAECKRRFSYDSAMAICLSSAQGSTPEMRAWCVGRLWQDESIADGTLGLRIGFSRLLGILKD